MSKQKPAAKAETPADPPTAPADPVVVAAGSENAPPASDPPADPALQQAEQASPQDAAGAAASAADVQGAAGDPPSGDPEPRRTRAVMPDADAAAAISVFLADWREDTPAEAAAGSYSPHSRDRFGDQDYSAIPDGTVYAHGWVFAFDDGQFIGAADLSTVREVAFVPRGQVIQISPA